MAAVYTAYSKPIMHCIILVRLLMLLKDEIRLQAEETKRPQEELRIIYNYKPFTLPINLDTLKRKKIHNKGIKMNCGEN